MSLFVDGLPMDVLRLWCGMVMDDEELEDIATVARVARSCSLLARLMREQTHRVARLREVALRRRLTAACEHIVMRYYVGGFEDGNGCMWGIEPALDAGNVIIYPPCHVSHTNMAPTSHSFTYRIHVRDTSSVYGVLSSWLARWCKPVMTPSNWSGAVAFGSWFEPDDVTNPVIRQAMWTPLNLQVTNHPRHSSVQLHWSQHETWAAMATQRMEPCKELTRTLLDVLAGDNLDVARQWKLL